MGPGGPRPTIPSPVRVRPADTFEEEAVKGTVTAQAGVAGVEDRHTADDLGDRAESLTCLRCQGNTGPVVTDRLRVEAQATAAVRLRAHVVAAGSVAAVQVALLDEAGPEGGARLKVPSEAVPRL